MQCLLHQNEKYPLGKTARSSPDKCIDWRDLQPVTQAVQEAVVTVPFPCCLEHYAFRRLVTETFYKHWENNKDFHQFQARGYILSWSDYVPRCPKHLYSFLLHRIELIILRHEKKIEECFKISTIFIKIKLLPDLSGTLLVQIDLHKHYCSLLDKSPWKQWLQVNSPIPFCHFYFLVTGGKSHINII